eukprot:6329073-Amphidinium_carterae.2
MMRTVVVVSGNVVVAVSVCGPGVVCDVGGGCVDMDAGGGCNVAFGWVLELGAVDKSGRWEVELLVAVL